ncbi:MAG TPA: type 4a pilus biogenesis protein PilO [Pyrinomonadaceae bacterium]|jgi:Tfp pilus assembly protein PilO
MKLGKLPNLPWYLRMLLFVAVAGVVYAGFWYLVTRSVRAETASLQGEIAQLKPRNAQAQVVQQRLNDFKAAYKAREEEYAELKALLPEQKEITMVLQGVQDRVHANGLALMRFSPKEDVLQDNYNGKKIEVIVVSSYASLRAFFEQLAHYQRIVSVTNFELRQLEQQSPSITLAARFEVTAYYVSSERLQKQVTPQAGSGGQTPSTPAPQPAK